MALFSHILLVLLIGAAAKSAHMAMIDPPPLHHKANPFRKETDYDYISPLSLSGSNYPCKGYHVDMGTYSSGAVGGHIYARGEQCDSVSGCILMGWRVLTGR